MSFSLDTRITLLNPLGIFTTPLRLPESDLLANNERERERERERSARFQKCPVSSPLRWTLHVDALGNNAAGFATDNREEEGSSICIFDEAPLR
jgi:hypothetical protein